MRKKDDTLRETLLTAARKITASQGIEAVNIRSLAQKAGVASGTVYNYFSGKDEILLALTEEFWEQTLLEMRLTVTADSFCGRLEEIFAFLKERMDRSALRLMNSLGEAQEKEQRKAQEQGEAQEKEQGKAQEQGRKKGREKMASMQTALKDCLLQCLEKDRHIRPELWTRDFTKERFIRFVMRNLIPLLKEEEADFYFFLETVRKMLL